MMSWPPVLRDPVWCDGCGCHHNLCPFCGTPLHYGRYGPMDAHGHAHHYCEIDVRAILGPCNETMFRELVAVLVEEGEAPKPRPVKQKAKTLPHGVVM